MDTDREHSEQQTKQSRWGFRGMTVRDWLQLLIVPLALVVIGFLFSVQQDARQQKIENQRAEAERELAEQRAQDEALQAYLDQMSQLMLERKLLEAEHGDPVHTLAQARTSTVILRLDAAHNESVTRFLSNSGLATRSDRSGALITGPAVSSEASPRLLWGITLSHATLSNAQLSDADLNIADLSGADLSNAFLYHANLGVANLKGASLNNADLSDADLSDARLRAGDLRNANLNWANLSDAGLSGALLNNAELFDANLSDADVTTADLSDADLSDANLVGTNLSDALLKDANLKDANLSDVRLKDANLSGAEGITNEKLERQATSLEGATMPNGQKYEDWLKSKDQNKNSDGSS